MVPEIPGPLHTPAPYSNTNRDVAVRGLFYRSNLGPKLVDLKRGIFCVGLTKSHDPLNMGLEVRDRGSQVFSA